ncbi:MAG: VWA domain-containing protein, partial [Acidimicrobiales bacterium]|nr:VWA domain-containing protein [Acidimicrobiales bacterium]
AGPSAHHGGADAPRGTWQSLTATSFGGGAGPGSGSAAPAGGATRTDDPGPGSDPHPGPLGGGGRLGRTGTSTNERDAVLRQLAMRPRTPGGIALADAVATTLPPRVDGIDDREPPEIDSVGDAPGLQTSAGPMGGAARAGRPVGRTVVVAVDASGTVGTHRRVEAATGAVLGLLSDAYLRRDRVSLVTFRGDSADVVLPPTASVELARTRLAELPTGGVTPLAEGLATGLSLARRAQADGWPPLLVLVTDGRATGNQNARERADAAAAELAAEGVEVVVIDAEDGPNRTGLADQLATATAGRCIRPAELTPAAVETAVRDALR